MKKLFVMRHAKSSWDLLELADHERPLSKRGIKSANLISEYFSANNINFDLIYTSSSRRTVETLDHILKKNKSNNVLESNELYLASEATLFFFIRKTNKTKQNLLLINHEPAISDFVLNICKNSGSDSYSKLKTKFPTCAVAEIEFLFKDWSDLDYASGNLIKFIRPKDIEQTC